MLERNLTALAVTSLVLAAAPADAAIGLDLWNGYLIPSVASNPGPSDTISATGVYSQGGSFSVTRTQSWAPTPAADASTAPGLTLGLAPSLTGRPMAAVVVEATTGHEPALHGRPMQHRIANDR